ncbi:MAG TPA: dihydrolipoamide acetyltransferase family protein [Geobacteraceae bacterium]
MATEITMPKLSDTMTEGRLLAWKKGVGEKVERGEIIAEVETDKATMELEAFTSGTLLEMRIKAGEMAPVGTVIAVIGAAGETASPQASPPEPVEKAAGAAAEAATPPAEPPPKAPEAAEAPRMEIPPAPEGTEEKASPLVRRLAREKGIDLAQVPGSGPEGRILQEDLEGFLLKREKPAEKPARPEAAHPPVYEGAQPLSRMRAAIAKNVSLAWQTIPHFSVTVAVDMGEAERVRQELKESGSPVSLNDLIVKAAASAIGKFPLVNASFGDDGITSHAEANIGIAVALDDGLLVPVIRGCQGLTLKEIAARSRDLAEKARAGRISEAEISGGTFSVSNLGMYGVEEFMAVILPPQGAILAVGAVADQPVIKGGHLAAARIMRATLSADHRLIDGAYAGRFLAELKRVLENPVGMLV